MESSCPVAITLACLLAVASGCPQDDEPPDPGGVEESTTSDTEATGSTSGSDSATDPGGEATTVEATSTGPEPPEVDLWACDLPADCPQLYYHVEPGEEGDLECPARVIVSGMAGHFTARHDDGSTLEEDTWLLVEAGGATAIVQTRRRQCPPEGECELSAEPWVDHSAAQRCTLGATEGLVEACMADAPACAWHPWYGQLEGCVDIEEPTCEELAALVDGG